MLLRVGASSLVGGFEADLRKVETLLSGMYVCEYVNICMCKKWYVVCVCVCVLCVCSVRVRARTYMCMCVRICSCVWIWI